MWIKEITTVGFNPKYEVDAIKQFIKENDMRDWVKTESNNYIAFIRTKSICMRGKK